MKIIQWFIRFNAELISALVIGTGVVCLLFTSAFPIGEFLQLCTSVCAGYAAFKSAKSAQKDAQLSEMYIEERQTMRTWHVN